MTEERTPGPRKGAQRTDRGDAAREKLLSASIDVFGRYGFEGATTRGLADAAGVNLQAIPYYFGGKEGLYIATAEHIASMIAAHVAELRDRIRLRLREAEEGGRPVEPDEASTLLTGILGRMAELFLSPRSEAWARFLTREQMQPTEAFERVYGVVMKPMLEVITKLIAILLGGDPSSEAIRLRTLALLGSVLAFRMAHAAVLAHLGWKTVGPRELRTVQTLVGDLVAAIRLEGAAR